MNIAATIERLETLERIRLTETQKEIFEFIISGPDRYRKYGMPRRSGKTFIAQLLLRRIVNNICVVVPNYSMVENYLREGFTRSQVIGNHVEIENNINILRPDMVVYDEVPPMPPLANIHEGYKVLHLWTPQDMLTPPHLTWDDSLVTFDTTKKEKEWDDDENR